ncbi:MAG: recombinase RecX [Flavobacteriaceae bacterium]|nr:recombinase RecX [Flavobacteriaceae bacterium]|tara:strand:+ start:3443 stop:3895 length:453 start_codon:yes stop_codon:yes gene_type:complete
MNNSIRKKIEFYCAYQERCHMEVNKKLNKLGVYGDEIDKYLSHLIDKNFLNETRFSENYVRGKFNNNDWGKIKIIQELKSRKISTWNINNALSEICDEDYLKKIRGLSIKIIKENSGIPKEKIKEKILNKLQYKGWEKELIFKEINTLIN